jgi:hypothetical protein
MLEVIGRSQHTTFWAYTRSWRVKTIYPILKAMSFMPNMKLWFSADAEMMPEEVPDGVRVAYMQTEPFEDVGNADLVFLDPPIRRQPIPLGLIPKVCPTETPDGKARGVSCATCRTCFKS